jgi:hypothetical protein
MLVSWFSEQGGPGTARDSQGQTGPGPGPGLPIQAKARYLVWGSAEPSVLGRCLDTALREAWVWGLGAKGASERVWAGLPFPFPHRSSTHFCVWKSTNPPGRATPKPARSRALGQPRICPKPAKTRRSLLCKTHQNPPPLQPPGQANPHAAGEIATETCDKTLSLPCLQLASHAGTLRTATLGRGVEFVVPAVVVCPLGLWTLASAHLRFVPCHAMPCHAMPCRHAAMLPFLPRPLLPLT